MSKSKNKPKYTIDELPPDIQEIVISRYRRKIFWKHCDELEEQAHKEMQNRIDKSPVLSGLEILYSEYFMDSEWGKGLVYSGVMEFEYLKNIDKIKDICSKDDFQFLKSTISTKVQSFIKVEITNPDVDDQGEMFIEEGSIIRKNTISKETEDRYIAIIEKINAIIVPEIEKSFGRFYEEAVSIYYRILNDKRMKKEMNDLGWTFYEDGRKVPVHSK